jgi:hypothetical protein
MITQIIDSLKYDRKTLLLRYKANPDEYNRNRLVRCETQLEELVSRVPKPSPS